MEGRLLITALTIVTLAVVYIAAQRWHLARVNRRLTRQDTKASPVLEALNPGVPAVVYFWSETCVPCRMVQRPAIEQVASTLGPERVQVIAINALEQPEVASEWGVLSLPTTFIIGRDGLVRHVNHGVTRSTELEKQIAQAA